jgi:hypothetical protein
MTYHVDRFFDAVTVLAGHGHVKQRLIRAYEENLADINDDELPIAVKQPFADLKQQLYRVTPLNGEAPVCASVRKMSAGEAGECAIAIVTLYREMLAGRQSQGENVVPLDTEELSPVPPFLVKSN